MSSFCRRFCENFKKEAISIVIVTAFMIVTAICGYVFQYKSEPHKNAAVDSNEGDTFFLYRTLMIAFYILSGFTLIRLSYKLRAILKLSRANDIGIQQEPWARRNPTLPERSRSYPRLNQPDDIQLFDIVSNPSNEALPSDSVLHPSMSNTQDLPNPLSPLRPVPQYIHGSLPDSPSSSIRTTSSSHTTRQLQSSTSRGHRSDRSQERSNTRPRKNQRNTAQDPDAHLHM